MPRCDRPADAAGHPRFWSDAADAAHTQNLVVKFGQAMYTSNDPLRTDLITDDRPYAGLLYLGMSWNRRRLEPQGTEILDTREITVGVIGPWSLARQSQTWFTTRSAPTCLSAGTTS